MFIFYAHMNDRLIFFFLKLGFIELNEERVSQWIAEEKVHLLEYALQHGLFKVRLKVLKGLGGLNARESLHLVLSALDDKVSTVAFAAIKVLEEWSLHQSYEVKINKILAYWEREEERQKEVAKTFMTKKLPPSYESRRTSKLTFENAKEMLKKPMPGSKWL